MGTVRRWRVSIVSAGCVASLLLLWLSFEVALPWAWWVRGVALLTIPLSFFSAIAVELSLAAAKAERRPSAEQKRRRRRAAWKNAHRDVAPVASRPALYFRPLTRAWELWRAHSPEPPPHRPSHPGSR